MAIEFEIRGSLVRVTADEVATEEQILDADLARRFSFDGDTLRLVGDSGGMIQHLLWQRVT